MPQMVRVGVVGIPDGWSSRKLTEAFKRKTGFGCLVRMRDVVMDLDRGRVFAGDMDLTELDALVVKKIGKTYSPDMLDRLAMLRYLQGRGVRVFSDPARMKRVLDRLSCTVTLRHAGIPMPPTVVTENIDGALEAIEAFGTAVLKPLYTSKARGMKVVKAGPDARRELEAFRAAGNQILYVQKMLDLPERDLGVAFLGGRFLGCYARLGRSESWNTTVFHGGVYHPHDPSTEILELAERAQAPFGLDMTCVDIAETDEGPVVFEVSAFGGFRGLLEASQIDAADRYADYVLEQLQRDG